MNLEHSFTIAEKEWKVYRRTKIIFAYTVALPLFFSLLFSAYVSSFAAYGIPSTYSLGLTMLTFFFVVLIAFLPSSIAAYSIIGEKVEKSLEPLLATPTTDSEILLGKSIAAFVPPILATWAGASIFMVVTDYLTYSGLSFYYFPNWGAGVILLLLAPLAAIFGIEIAVIASSRLNDVRAVNQIATLTFAPFMLVFVAGSIQAITLSIDNLLIFCGILLTIDVALFYMSRATFKREEILTKWK